MRMFLNVGVVLVCGALAGLSSLVRGAPTEAAVLSTTLPSASSLVPLADGTSPPPIPAGRTSGVEARFASANTTHDGHLTKDQVERSDWTRVARHFDEIDTANRGWISVEEIHAFNRMHRGHRKSTTG